MKKLLFPFLTFFFFAAQSQNTAFPSRLKVSDNKRYLVYENGKPFFWLGDTGWELFHRLTYAEADRYLSKRASQGYNVIQAVVLAEFDGLHAPNANGHTPLENDDPAKPVEAYFRFVDSIVDLAGKHGLYIALLPTWGDKVFKDRWGQGPEIFTVTNAKPYGEWIGNRYKNKSNIIWVVGGDRNPRNEVDVSIWSAMAEGIVTGCGGYDRALMTFHPQPSETCSSSPWFQEVEWLDFNMLQTGHCEDAPVWNKIGDDYKKKNVKPVLNAEAVYEEHPLCFNAKQNGYSSAYDSRKAAYLSVFAGSLGYTYGCHSMWQFYAPERTAVNGPLRFWYVSMDLPAASQMIHLKKLMEAFPAENRMPDSTFLLKQYSGTSRIQAMRGNLFALIYSAAGEPIELKMGMIYGETLKSYWYDPRTGAKFMNSRVINKGLMKFTPPSKGRDNDWVLVLYEAKKKYFQ